MAKILVAILILHLTVNFARAQTKCSGGKIYIPNGSLCFATCQHPHRPRYCKPQYAAGCYCPPDLILDEQNNKCVSEGDCPDKYTCPTHEHEEWGSYCIPTCQQPTKPTKCLESLERACYCDDGYYRDIISQKCVQLKNCPE